MSTATVFQDPNADFSAAFAAAGVDAPLLADFDLLPQTGLRAVYEFRETSGAVLADYFAAGDVARNAATTGVTFDGTKGTLAAGVGNKIALPIAATASFEFTFLARLLAGPDGMLLGPYVTNTLGAYGRTSTGSTGQFILTAPGTSAFFAVAQYAQFTGKWRIVSLSVDADTRRVSAISDATIESWATSTTAITAAPGNFTIGSNGTIAAPNLDLALMTVHDRRLSSAERDLNFKFFRQVAADKGLTIG